MSVLGEYLRDVFFFVFIESCRVLWFPEWTFGRLETSEQFGHLYPSFPLFDEEEKERKLDLEEFRIISMMNFCLKDSIVAE